MPLGIPVRNLWRFKKFIEGRKNIHIFWFKKFLLKNFSFGWRKIFSENSSFENFDNENSVDNIPNTPDFRVDSALPIVDLLIQMGDENIMLNILKVKNNSKKNSTNDSNYNLNKTGNNGTHRSNEKNDKNESKSGEKRKFSEINQSMTHTHNLFLSNTH